MDRLTRVWTNRRIRWYVLVGVGAFVVYELSREPGAQNYNQYVRLASAFLHGRLDIVDAQPWLELVTFKGRHYSHQGVLPAILLMPFVAVFGPDFNLRHFAALLGGGISVAAWSLASRIGLEGRERLLGWMFPVLGTTVWYEAKTGHTWGVAALASVLLLFLALNEYFGPQRLWLVGLCVGLAGLARPPAFLALIGFALFLRSPRKLLQLGLGAVGPLAVMLVYNFLRFGSVIDRAQQLHYVQDNFRTQRPPGLFSPAHLPFNMYSWFLLTPQFQDSFPFLKLTIMGTGLPFTSPAFISSLGARRERWLWVAGLVVLIPAALYYANGFAQFGMRYLLDLVPFVSALVFIALRDDRAPGYTVLLGLSVAMNAYGVAYTNVFGLQQP